MIRNKLTAIAAVAALALAACSANTGNAEKVAPSSGDTVASQQSTTQSSGGSAAGPTGVQTSAGGTESAGAGTAEGETASEAETSQATVTIGGDVDAQTAAWFSAFCTGMAPLGEIGSIADPSKLTDPAAMRKSYSDYLKTFGQAMIDTAAKVKPLPPPTFDKGAEIAGKLVTGLGQAGPVLKASADALAKADITSPEQLQAAVSAAMSSMEGALAGLSLDNYELDEKTEDQVSKLPACATLFAAEGAIPTS